MVTKIMIKNKSKKNIKSRKKKTMKQKINDRNTKLRSMRVGGGAFEFILQKAAEKTAKKALTEAVKNPDEAAKRLAGAAGIDPNKLASGAAGVDPNKLASGDAGVDPKLGANPDVAKIIEEFERRNKLQQSQGFKPYNPGFISKAVIGSTYGTGIVTKVAAFASSKAGEDLANKWGIGSNAYKEGLGDAQKNLQPFLKDKISEPSPQSQPKSSWFKRTPKPASASFDPNKATASASFGDASGKAAVSASPSGKIKASGTANIGGVPASASGKISANGNIKAKANLGGVTASFNSKKNKFSIGSIKVKMPKKF